jgi:hypothetical protein
MYVACKINYITYISCPKLMLEAANFGDDQNT